MQVFLYVGVYSKIGKVSESKQVLQGNVSVFSVFHMTPWRPYNPSRQIFNSSSILDVLLSERSSSDATSCVFVQIQVEAYMFTLRTSIETIPSKPSSYLSMQVPGVLAPTLRAEKPHLSKILTYHGLRDADRRRTRPPFRRTWFRALIWIAAASWEGSNQSIESMTLQNISHLHNTKLQGDNLQPQLSKFRVSYVRSPR